MLDEERYLETDVLVIGGGMAGCFAAVKAREKGCDVTLVDKGGVGRSGGTPWVTGIAIFNPKWGHDLEEWIAFCLRNGEYMVNRTWLEMMLKDSFARYEDLSSWGLRFCRTLRGSQARVGFSGAPTDGLLFINPKREIPGVLRRKVKSSGIHILERTMLTGLLKGEGRVIGAVGFTLDRRERVIIKAKAVIMCTGAGSFKPYGYPIASLTSDGDAMAYRAGAEITGKEFPDDHWTFLKRPFALVQLLDAANLARWPLRLYPGTKFPLPNPPDAFVNRLGDAGPTEHHDPQRHPVR
jgi:succinate dehydrogenase/fumarate reductase flavoprotein subunit